MKRDKEFFGFFLGQSISQMGTLTYAAVLPALLAKQHVSFAFIGLLIAVLRITGVSINAFFGHLGDRFSARTIVILTESVSALAAISIGLGWRGEKSSLLIFLCLNIVRTSMTSMQSAGAQKLIKIMDDKYGSEGRLGVWLNNTSNAGMFFGSVVAVLLFDEITVPRLVAFDAATFLINGLVVLTTTNFQQSKSTTANFRAQFNPKEYFAANKTLFFEDMLLALALMGSNTMNVMLLSGDLKMAPLLPGLFGLSGLVSSLVLKSRVFNRREIGWSILCGAFLLTFATLEYPVAIAIFTTIRNFGYWLVFHRITREIVRTSKSGEFAAVASGRLASTTAVLGFGEVWLGEQLLPLRGELLWRGSLSAAQALRSAFGQRSQNSSARSA